MSVWAGWAACATSSSVGDPTCLQPDEVLDQRRHCVCVGPACSGGLRWEVSVDLEKKVRGLECLQEGQLFRQSARSVPVPDMTVRALEDKYGKTMQPHAIKDVWTIVGARACRIEVEWWTGGRRFHGRKCRDEWEKESTRRRRRGNATGICNG